jgi:dolichol-phosphate mannosyltransferase
MGSGSSHQKRLRPQRGARITVVDLAAFFPAQKGTILTQDGAEAGRTLVVLPTFNERDNLVPVVDAVQQYLPGATVLIVDDNSPDGTGKIADTLAAERTGVCVLHRAGKLGLGTAYVEAFRWALAREYDVLIQMDVDFSHGPHYLPRLVEALTEADMVIGSRYTPGGGTENWSRMRQFISQGGNWVARIGLGIQTRDATGGYRAFRRPTLERLHFKDLGLRGYGFQIEVVYQVERLGLTIREVPITFVERAAGQSKMSKDIVLEAILHIIRRRLRALSRERSPQGEASVPMSDEA